MTSAGYYLVKVQDDNGCFAYASVDIEECEPITTPPQNEIGPASITVFPNPNDGEFTVQLSAEPKGKGRLAIYNAIGKRMYYIDFTKEGELFEQQISLPHLANAVYVLRITLNGEVYNHKLLVTN